MDTVDHNFSALSTTLICLNPFPNKPWFLRVCSTGLLKTLWEKEKLLVTSNFSFSHSVFYPFQELSAIFIKFRICHLQTLSVWKSLKLVVWERVNNNLEILACPVCICFRTLAKRMFSGYTGVSLFICLSIRQHPSVYKILVIFCHELFLQLY